MADDGELQALIDGEGQLIKPDTLCIDIGRFTVDMACAEYGWGRTFTPLRIGEAPFAQRTVSELAKQGSYVNGDDGRGMLGELVGSERRAPLAPAAFSQTTR